MLFALPSIMTSRNSGIRDLYSIIYDTFGGAGYNALPQLTVTNLTAHVPDSEVSAPVKVWGMTGDLFMNLTDSNGLPHNNQLTNNNGEAAYAYVSKFKTDDQIATITFAGASHIAHFDDRMGVMLRSDSSTGSKNGYEFRYNFNQNTFAVVEIYYWIAGASTLIYSTTISSTPSAQYIFEFSVIGSIITLRVDSLIIYSGTDENITPSSSKRDFVITAVNSDGTKSNNYIDDVAAVDVNSCFKNYLRLINGVSWAADVPAAISANVYSASLSATTYAQRMRPAKKVYIGENGAISLWAKYPSSGNGLIGSQDGLSYLAFNNTTSFNISLINAAETSNYSFTCNSPVTMTAGNWYHFLLMRKNGVTMLYINGSIETTYGGVNQTGWFFNFDYIGYQITTNIADVRVYGDILSDSDIAALAAGGNASITPIHWWKMNEGAGILGKDYGIYDADGYKYINAALGLGAKPQVDELYAVHELFANLKSDQLLV